MDFRFENYAITHDGLNYVVNKVSIVSTERGKPENVGKEALRSLKYYSTLIAALKSIRDMAITDNLQGRSDLDDAIDEIVILDAAFLKELEKWRKIKGAE